MLCIVQRIRMIQRSGGFWLACQQMQGLRGARPCGTSDGGQRHVMLHSRGRACEHDGPEVVAFRKENGGGPGQESLPWLAGSPS